MEKVVLKGCDFKLEIAGRCPCSPFFPESFNTVSSKPVRLCLQVPLTCSCNSVNTSLSTAVGLKNLSKGSDLIPSVLHPSSYSQDAHMAETQSWILVRCPYLLSLVYPVCDFELSKLQG